MPADFITLPQMLGTALAAAILAAAIIDSRSFIQSMWINGDPERNTCSTDPNAFMYQPRMGMLSTKEYRGCGIEAASYKSGAKDWVPEACFWLHTTQGWRRLWIASFAHCLGRFDLTFSRKIDADIWAFRVARDLIDRTLPEFMDFTEVTDGRQTNCIARLLNIVRRPFSTIPGLKDFAYRN
jgi:hypothetical protein